MLKKWLNLLGVFIVIGIVGGDTFSQSQTATLAPKGGITLKAVATKHSTMNELVIVNDRGKLVTAKIK